MFNAIDSDTGLCVNVMVEIEFSINDENVKENHFTPILLQESKKLVSLKVIEDDYYEFKM